MAKGCGKIRYRHAEGARWAARQLFWETGVRKVTYYFCPLCRAYHLTTKRARKGRI